VVIIRIPTTLVAPILRILHAGQPEADIAAEDAESQVGNLSDLWPLPALPKSPNSPRKSVVARTWPFLV